MSYQQEKFTEIADAIREKTGTTDLIKPSEFASKVDDVFEAGEKSARDLFWEGFQQGGTRTGYNYGFYGIKMSKRFFKPKYDFKPVGCSSMSQGFKTLDEPVSITEVEQECGIVFDFSNCTNFYMAFCNDFWEELNVVDLKSAQNSSEKLHYAFYGGYGTNLKRINRLICYEGTTFNTTTFQGLSKLKYIGFEGVITSSINFSNSTSLEKESILKLFNCLKTLSDGETKTITLGATNLAKLTDTEKAIATEKGWTLA